MPSVRSSPQPLETVVCFLFRLVPACAHFRTSAGRHTCTLAYFFFLLTPSYILYYCQKKKLSTQQAETWTRTSHTIPFPSSWACSNEGGDSCFAGIAEIAGAAGYMHTGQGAEGCLWPKTAWLRGQAAQVCVVWRRCRCVRVSLLSLFLPLSPLSPPSLLSRCLSPLSDLFALFPRRWWRRWGWMSRVKTAHGSWLI